MFIDRTFEKMKEGRLILALYLHLVQSKAAKFALHRNKSNWESLARRPMIAHICALLKRHGRTGLKDIGDRLYRQCYLSRSHHDRKIRSRKQRKDIGKYSFVNRTTQLRNQLLSDAIVNLSCTPSNFRKRARKVIKQVK
jgi:hypothetical protein